MNLLNKNIGCILCGFSIFILSTSYAQNIEVKAYKTRLSDVMDNIATQAKKKVVLSTDQNPLISIGSKDANLQDTLKKIENLYGFTFEIKKDEIIVKEKEEKKNAGGRNIATSDDDSEAAKDMTPMELRANGFRYRSINMNYQEPAGVIKQVKNIVGEDVKFIETDDKNKAVVFYGDETMYRLVRQIIDDLDVPPPQVLLSAKVVEVSANFARDLGVQLDRQGGSKGNFTSSNLGANGKFIGDYTFGIIDSTGLSAALSAGESNGDSRTISSPQIITLDGKDANLSSDLTLSVRVTSSGSSSSGGSTTGGTTGGTAGATTGATGLITGGLQQVSAGLKLSVTPKILRDGKIKLQLDLSNSSFNKGASQDGIPGVSSTAVKSEMVLRTGQTAAIAGLYKFITDNTDAGVPLAMNIPLFGWLFKSNSRSKTRQEVMAFITPAILEAPSERSISIVKEKDDDIKGSSGPNNTISR